MPAGCMLLVFFLAAFVAGSNAPPTPPTPASSQAYSINLAGNLTCNAAAHGRILTEAGCQAAAVALGRSFLHTFLSASSPGGCVAYGADGVSFNVHTARTGAGYGARLVCEDGERDPLAYRRNAGIGQWCDESPWYGRELGAAECEEAAAADALPWHGNITAATGAPRGCFANVTRAGYLFNDHKDGGPATTAHMICGYAIRPSVAEQIINDGQYSTRRRFARNFGTGTECEAAADTLIDTPEDCKAAAAAMDKPYYGVRQTQYAPPGCSEYNGPNLGPPPHSRYTSFHGIIFNPYIDGVAPTPHNHVLCRLPPAPPARFVVNRENSGQPEVHGDAVVTSWQECQLAFEFLECNGDPACDPYPNKDGSSTQCWFGHCPEKYGRFLPGNFPVTDSPPGCNTASGYQFGHFMFFNSLASSTTQRPTHWAVMRAKPEPEPAPSPSPTSVTATDSPTPTAICHRTGCAMSPSACPSNLSPRHPEWESRCGCGTGGVHPSVMQRYPMSVSEVLAAMTCVAHKEQRHLRCCRDTAPASPGWIKQEGCPWATSGVQPGMTLKEALFGPDKVFGGCFDKFTFPNAQAHCASGGARLCSLEELVDKECTAPTGHVNETIIRDHCGTHRGNVVWSSDGGSTVTAERLLPMLPSRYRANVGPGTQCGDKGDTHINANEHYGQLTVDQICAGASYSLGLTWQGNETNPDGLPGCHRRGTDAYYNLSSEGNSRRNAQTNIDPLAPRRICQRSTFSMSPPRSQYPRNEGFGAACEESADTPIMLALECTRAAEAYGLVYHGLVEENTSPNGCILRTGDFHHTMPRVFWSHSVALNIKGTSTPGTTLQGHARADSLICRAPALPVPAPPLVRKGNRMVSPVSPFVRNIGAQNECEGTSEVKVTSMAECKEAAAAFGQPYGYTISFQAFAPPGCFLFNPKLSDPGKLFSGTDEWASKRYGQKTGVFFNLPYLAAAPPQCASCSETFDWHNRPGASFPDDYCEIRLRLDPTLDHTCKDPSLWMYQYCARSCCEATCSDVPPPPEPDLRPDIILAMIQDVHSVCKMLDGVPPTPPPQYVFNSGTGAACEDELARAVTKAECKHAAEVLGMVYSVIPWKEGWKSNKPGCTEDGGWLVFNNDLEAVSECPRSAVCVRVAGLSRSPSAPPSSHSPSAVVSRSASEPPSWTPSKSPSLALSASPSRNPSESPSAVVSSSPSEPPSWTPSKSPSWTPSKSPSWTPSETHSVLPSSAPSSAVSSQPSGPPSVDLSTDSPTPHPCSGLKMKKCNKRKKCTYDKKKNVKFCAAKQEVFGIDCAQTTGKTLCEAKDWCKYSNATGCTHQCKDLKKKSCIAMRDSSKKKICKYTKEKNPCFKCHPVTKCS